MAPDSDLTAAVRALLPIRAADGRLDVRLEWDSHGAAEAPLRPGEVPLMLVYFRDGGYLDDIKAQRVRLPDVPLERDRLADTLLGWALAVEVVLRDCTWIETLVPQDLAPSRDVFVLKQPRAAEGYCSAFLMPSRLGRFLRRGR